MPQTIEAISHAKNAGVPMIVAINKVDLPDANAMRVKQDLLQHGVVLEEFGGTTLLDRDLGQEGDQRAELLEQILLQAEILDLKANPDKPAHRLCRRSAARPGQGAGRDDPGVRAARSRVGDDFICGLHSGRVRAHARRARQDR
jgi:translation initiation factor IF-2